MTNCVISAVMTSIMIVMIFSWRFGQGQEIEWEETTMNKTLHSAESCFSVALFFFLSYFFFDEKQTQI